MLASPSDERHSHCQAGMKTFKSLVKPAWPIIAILFTCGSTNLLGTTLVLTEQDNGKTVMATVGSSLMVQLKGNPTTGYVWALTSTNGDSVSITGDWSYTPDSGGLVGGGGVFDLPMQAVRVGVTTLSFNYARPSDPQNPAQIYSVTINVVDMPRLAVQLQGRTNVIVLWPIENNDGFYIEGSRAFASGWTALNVVTVPIGTNYTVSLPVSGNLLFFRLRQ
jgi:inhibitor of cysteine peptidase